MKLNELLAVNANNEITDHCIYVHEGNDIHLFISDEDYKSFDLDKYGIAEVTEFFTRAIEEPYEDEVCTYLTIICEMPKTLSSEIEAMREAAEEFLDYLDEFTKVSF